MQMLKVLAGLSLLILLTSPAMAEKNCSEKKCEKEIVKQEARVDRSSRTNPYPNTPSYAQGGNSSRYDTSNAWSRGGYNNWWYYGNRGGDIRSSGYTPPPSRR